MALEWDLTILFDKEHKKHLAAAKTSLDSKGLRTQTEGELQLLVSASDQLLRIEAERCELDLEADEDLLANQRLDLVRSLVDHVPLPQALSGETKTRAGHPITMHRWVADGVCEVVPLHDKPTIVGLWKQVAHPANLILPIDAMREYFGEHVTLYFAWTNFFTLWLLAPGAVGCFMWFFRPKGTTVEDSPLIPFFSLFVVLWGVVFMRFWQRRNAEWSCMWNTLEFEKREIPNQDFDGELRMSPVTGREELYYPAWRRAIKYCISALVTGVMLCVAFFIMVCSLNLQGYIQSRDDLFHVPYLFRHSQPGHIFDPEGSFVMSMIPVVGHSIIILILNQHIYSRIALKLTQWENHRTEAEFENALILKRFLFEAFDSYVALFYLAFVERNVLMLRVELVGLYTTDAVRRVLTESLIPLLLQWIGRMCSSKTDKVVLWSPREQVRRDEYEQFDDYLEMVIEFGYITLFASAFPLAAALSVACNYIEVRSDMFKLAYVTRRPPATRAANIGTWEKVLSAQVWLAIVTNCLIFALSSDQLAEWMPWLFHDANGVGRDAMRKGSGRIVVGVAWAIEHGVVLIALAVWALIDSKPAWVREELAREDFAAAAVRKAEFTKARKRLMSSAAARRLAGKKVAQAKKKMAAQTPPAADDPDHDEDPPTPAPSSGARRKKTANNTKKGAQTASGGSTMRLRSNRRKR